MDEYNVQNRRTDMDEKLKILEMVEAGTVTAQQAAEMIAETDNAAARSVELPPGYDRKMFRIIVDGAKGDKVNIQLPVGAVRRILDIAGRLPVPEETFQGVDVSELMDAVIQCFAEGAQGDLVDADTADGTRVRVCVE